VTSARARALRRARALPAHSGEDLEADGADGDDQKGNQGKGAEELRMDRSPDAGHPPHEPAQRRPGQQESIEAPSPRGPRGRPLIRRWLNHAPVAPRQNSTYWSTSNREAHASILRNSWRGPPHTPSSPPGGLNAGRSHGVARSTRLPTHPSGVAPPRNMDDLRREQDEECQGWRQQRPGPAGLGCFPPYSLADDQLLRSGRADT
jgi:hypothetical protein